MSSNHQHYDEELAALTDALLENQKSPAPSSENEELYKVVQALHRTIEPDKAPSPLFRSRLQNRLVNEWKKSRRVRQPVWRNQRFWARRLAPLAAVMLVVIATVLFLDDAELAGTAEGEIGLEAVIVVLGLLILGLVMFWRLRRR